MPILILAFIRDGIESVTFQAMIAIRGLTTS